MSWSVFHNYADATESQYNSYEQVIASKSGAVTNPSATGKVFDLATAKKNIENGTAPAVDKLIAGAVENPEMNVLVRRITDGDTIVALLPDSEIEQDVRLAGIDAPDKGHTGYKESSAWLEGVLLGQTITLRVDQKNAKDVYGRVIAVAVLGGRDICLESLKQGWSIFYPYAANIFVDNTAYKAAQDSAKAARLGIWGMILTPAEAVTPSAPTTAGPVTSDLQTFWEDLKTYYSGRMYASKSELVKLAAKYGLSTAGLG